MAEAVFQQLLPQLRVPTATTALYKEECAFSFHTQVRLHQHSINFRHVNCLLRAGVSEGPVPEESDGGLYVDLQSFQAFSPAYAQLNLRKTGHKLYLNLRKKRVPKPEVPQSDAPAVTVLAIGVPGGFVDKEKNFDVMVETAVVVLGGENLRFPWPDSRNTVPMKLAQVVDAVINFDSAEKKADVAAWMAGEEVKESKYARTLIQLDNGVKVAKGKWKCARCDKEENLWMNLSTGEIGCGRKNFDGTGGNGHALEHFKESSFPLVVKLGTITPDGTADVYSYAPDEDNEVLDPLLEDHLAHWGIDMKEMKKTDKSLAEMQIELQYSVESSKILAGEQSLQPIYGPGYTGIENLGNSCYMASVMQVLFSLPPYVQRYFKNADRFFEQTTNPSKDFFVQMSKLAVGLWSGAHSAPPAPVDPQAKFTPFARLLPQFTHLLLTEVLVGQDERGIRPVMFKRLIGEGHKEFSTNRQQDAMEYFQYLMQLINRSERAKGEGVDVSKAFEFKVEEKVQCSQSHKYSYTYRDDNVLSLPIPLEKAVNLDAVKAYEAAVAAAGGKTEGIEKVVPNVRFEDCLSAFLETEAVEHFYSSAIDARTTALKTTRMASFPAVLMVQVRKFTLDGWVPKKLDLTVLTPDLLDLESLRAKGLQPGEELLPAAPAAAGPKIDQAVVAELEAMGIPRVRAERASAANPGQPTGVAIDWVFSHADDADIDTPLPKAPAGGASGAKSGVEVPEENVRGVMDMGFSRAQALKALQATDNSMERAVDWLFSHPDDSMDVEAPAAAPDVKAAAPQIDQGPAKYELVAFISHMGSSTMSGHYVAHIKKNGHWILFNDAKVAICDPATVPKEMAYLYVFSRL